MTQNHCTYTGVWELIPELCVYEENDPPRSGLYTIERIADRVRMSIVWETLEGQSHSIEFGGAIDGSKQPVGNNPVSEVSFLHVDAATLDSSVFSSDTRMAYARRRASADGTLLATVQESRRPDGSTYRNFQVYRRRDSKVLPNKTIEPTR
jgi:hypothetical protein